MKKIVVSLFVICASLCVTEAQELSSKMNAWGVKLEESPVHLSFDLQTKYVWRGMEMMTQNSSPVFFPSISYSKSGFYVYAMGGYSLNGIYSEVDLGLSYAYKWLTIAVNDYYYPTTTIANDKYFDFNKTTTGHWLEGTLTIAPEKIPAYILFSNFFYGADKTIEGKQAYSTYVELGAHYDFLADNSLSLVVGAALNEGCYTGYERGFGVCNIELKYTHTVHFANEWTLPLNVSYIINPIREKAFVNFSTSFAF